MKRALLGGVALFLFGFTDAALAQAMKWHPGHYVLLDTGSTLEQHFKHIDEIAGVSSIKGVQVPIWWYELERSKGAYDFSQIDAYLKKLKSLPQPKRLVVRVMDRKFNTSTRTGILPNYMLSDSIYKGGVVRTRTGYAARLWESPVMDRLIALDRAIGARYNDDRYFEGIATEETTLSVESNPPPGYSSSALLQQYIRFVKAVRSAMPETSLFLNTNWLGTDSTMATLIQALLAPQIATGSSNTRPGFPNQGQKVWTGQLGADYRGLLAISSGAEQAELGGRKGDFTPKQINDYAYNTLRVNYFFWIRLTWSGDASQRWSTGILPFLKTNPPIRTSCPTNYGLCTQ